MREINVGIRIDLDEGLAFSGLEVINGLINCGGRVTSIEPGGAVMRKLGEDGQQVRLTLAGCDIKVVVDDSAVAASPEIAEHDRLHRAGSDRIMPYIHLVGRQSRPPDEGDARSEIEGGIATLRQAIAIIPSNWSAWWLIGKAYQALGNPASACEAFGKAFALHKENADVAREYMYECLHIGKTDKAIAAARQAVRVKPEDAGLHSNLGLALLVGAKLAEASAAVDEALKLAPDDAISRNLRQIISDVRSGRRPQPKSLAELEGRKP